MSDSSATAVPLWLTRVVWSFAIGIALLGIVVAIASSSFWPLICIAGLVLPLFPIGTPRTTRSTARDA
ncbi:hypothetical protein AB0N73_05930 [Microbacterium sp. NPDC089189]|uniref:hypothetical protein n=1 Tax=Microbacterium sp. NPDC089189 TaxID=3154972 RepID=UPI003420FDF0